MREKVYLNTCGTTLEDAEHGLRHPSAGVLPLHLLRKARRRGERPRLQRAHHLLERHHGAHGRAQRRVRQAGAGRIGNRVERRMTLWKKNRKYGWWPLIATKSL